VLGCHVLVLLLVLLHWVQCMPARPNSRKLTHTQQQRRRWIWLQCWNLAQLQPVVLQQCPGCCQLGQLLPLQRLLLPPQQQDTMQPHTCLLCAQLAPACLQCPGRLLVLQALQLPAACCMVQRQLALCP
jgi:hypothetical protein